METVFDVIQSLQLNFSQMLMVALPIFLLGYAIGSLRTRRLIKEKDALELAVMALNEELLYSGSATEDKSKSVAPVIGLKDKSYKNPQIAK